MIDETTRRREERHGPTRGGSVPVARAVFHPDGIVRRDIQRPGLSYCAYDA
jgi:hypothetical protein